MNRWIWTLHTQNIFIPGGLMPTSTCKFVFLYYKGNWTQFARSTSRRSQTSSLLRRKGAGKKESERERENESERKREKVRAAATPKCNYESKHREQQQPQATVRIFRSCCTAETREYWLRKFQSKSGELIWEKPMSLTESVWKREWNGMNAMSRNFWYNFAPYLIY